MKSILFLMYPLKGPLYASFRIAELLRAKGYNVVYIAPLKYQQLIEEQGWIFTSIDDHSCQQNYIDERKIVRYYTSLLETDVTRDGGVLGMFGEIIRRHQPAGVVIDADIVGFALIFYYYKIPVVFINNHFQSDKTPNAPPFFSAYIPSGKWLSRQIVRCIWAKRLAIKRVFRWIERLRAGIENDIDHARLARACGFPLEKFAEYDRSWLYRLSNFPEFFLYPPELDFKRPLRENQFYLGPMVSLDRKEPPFDWDKIGEGKKIAYCSLGTLPDVYVNDIIKFYEKIIKVFDSFKQIILVLAVGNCWQEIEGMSIPENVRILKNVPQLEVLKRASLMINHGGINSVKECILSGVPMIAYPLSPDNDQKGTAARIVYLGLGRRGKITDTRRKIRRDVFELLNNPIYQLQIDKMRKKFQTYKESEHQDVEMLTTHFTAGGY
jgi:zeaxanthin glucosyltransferase